MKFYLINDEYLDFLRTFDSKIMNGSNNYKDFSKFTVGIVFSLNNIKYYAPISSVKPTQLETPTSIKKHFKKTCLPIFVNNHGQQVIVSLIRLDFMFPVPDNEVELLVFNSIQDEKYKNFIKQEYSYILSIQDDIIRKSNYIYKSAINPSHFFNKICCNFKLLEAKYQDWIKGMKN